MTGTWAPATLRAMSDPGQDRSRMLLVVSAALWLSAAVAVFLGFKLRLKPLLIVGLLDGLLALAVTTIALRGGGPPRITPPR